MSPLVTPPKHSLSVSLEQFSVIPPFIGGNKSQRLEGVLCHHRTYNLEEIVLRFFMPPSPKRKDGPLQIFYVGGFQGNAPCFWPIFRSVLA